MTKSELETLAQELTNENEMLKAELAELKSKLAAAEDNTPVKREAVLAVAV